MRRLLIALSVGLLSIAASRLAVAQGIQVVDPWTRATQAGRPAAVYLQLNGGPDRLTGVASDVAGRSELHETVVEDGATRMRPTGGVMISPGARTRLAPGGMHIMLLDLRKPLKEGDVVQVTLSFERSRALVVNVPVLSVRATGPGNTGTAAPGGTGAYSAPVRR